MGKIYYVGNESKLIKCDLPKIIKWVKNYVLKTIYQWNQWADNSKTKKARVSVLTHDTFR